ncbi:hypothetical protein NXS98_04090 [Fontisphaera persica]|uniref:hypothetical protein n=1 Tax=Fontisphaera persica TaxID=2974023 RepID=UPI0024BFE4F0|nr:hypothetical protein [Fontisphaera persica]WCJ60321.1 hypothetical protein NXS98_04090 [Fontisphaera persica]
MNGSISTERLLRFLQATPEQQAAIERILDGPTEAPAQAAVATAAAGTGLVPAEPFISKAEAAMRMGKDVRTITTYMRKGLLPHYKLGHTVVFKWSEVEKQLAVMCRVNRSRC